MNHFVVYHDSQVDGLCVGQDAETAVAMIRQALLGVTPTPIVSVLPLATAPVDDVVRGLALAFMNVMAMNAAAANQYRGRRH